MPDIAMWMMVMLLAYPSSTLPIRRHLLAKGKAPVKFLVVGDWGREGLYNQSLVADQMGMVAKKMGVDFIISTGDNFYHHGLKGVDDPLFNRSFSSIYTAPSLQKPWYSVLGNHDYRGNVGAQLNPALTQVDQRWFCARSFLLIAGTVEIVFVDTTPFVDEYFGSPEGHTYDWSDVMPRHDYLANLLHEVESALSKSTATWKIVVGHHTIESAGYHGNTPELQSYLLPLLEEYHVDVYINGHDHCLQQISSMSCELQFITSGGGSKAWKGEVKARSPDEMKFYYDGQGFISVALTSSKAKVNFYDVHGNVLHTWHVSKKSLV